MSDGDEGNISVIVLFDDGGAALPGDVPVDGTFAPQELLFAFIGESPVGIWTLTISDDTDEDPLGLFSATLNITVTETGNPGTGVPEPATLALFGAGILGLGWARRRRKVA